MATVSTTTGRSTDADLERMKKEDHGTIFILIVHCQPMKKKVKRNDRNQNQKGKVAEYVLLVVLFKLLLYTGLYKA